MQTGLFAQLVVVPLFTKHHVLAQVAGHDLPVLKGLPPLVVSEQDVDDFADALDDVIAKAGRPHAALAQAPLGASRLAAVARRALAVAAQSCRCSFGLASARTARATRLQSPTQTSVMSRRS